MRPICRKTGTEENPRSTPEIHETPGAAEPQPNEEPLEKKDRAKTPSRKKPFLFVIPAKAGMTKEKKPSE